LQATPNPEAPHSNEKKPCSPERGPAQDFLRFPLKHPSCANLNFLYAGGARPAQICEGQAQSPSTTVLTAARRAGPVATPLRATQSEAPPLNEKIMQPMWPGQVDSVRSRSNMQVAPISEFLYAGVASEVGAISGGQAQSPSTKVQINCGTCFNLVQHLGGRLLPILGSTATE
jgi:hypothetical protein